METYVILLSGGLDSVVNLHLAKKYGKVLKAIHFDYGQRAAVQEKKAAEFYCRELDISLEIVSLPFLKALTSTALVHAEIELPQIKDLDDIKEGMNSAVKVWVPNRNGLFLNIAAVFAESLGAQFVVPGFNKEEAATFPDNSQEFLNALEKSFSYSTLSHVKLKCFTTALNKTEIVKVAKDNAIDLSKVWSCYQGGDRPCGKCESCQRSERANRS